MSSISATIRRLPTASDLPLPAYESEQAAGMDLFAAVHKSVVLAPGERALIPTGISIALPANYEAQVRPRSGLALHNGVTLLNAPGTIDADYRGEIGAILINQGSEPFTVTRGMRVAQMVIASVSRMVWTESDSLPETARGTGGFGSTGTCKGGS